MLFRSQANDANLLYKYVRINSYYVTQYTSTKARYTGDSGE